ncbi:PREDICTED: uncharacterized protein LOC104739745 [Camelina sativa]|uniref:Uncharacterized protein LOC104739745 n=1 Tax=Camelina sativa TaxID=90675 RepID=A0ABM0VMM7_CAMSA|nr:PREDICTED: uncharacterized protein LOC104739745 [Camelina sativa]
MRLEDRFEVVNQYRKKMFQKVKAAVKKTTKKKKKKQTMFQYDPWSYALNFDDGVENPQRVSGDSNKLHKITLIYVVYVNF